MKPRVMPSGRQRRYSAGPAPRKHLPELQWPEIDRVLFERVFYQSDDPFIPQAICKKLVPSTRQGLWYAYRRWLGWLSKARPELLHKHPCDRVDRETITNFRAHLQASCKPNAIAGYIGKLYAVMSRFEPEHDWQWLRAVVTRLECAAGTTERPAVPFTSETLHRLSREVCEMPNRWLWLKPRPPTA
jgi:hypothetical protein